MKLVREHIIFEKFTEDSDPVEDLGIGNEFVRAKIGDIIEPKKIIYVSGTKKIYFKKTPQTTPHVNYFGVIADIKDIKHNFKNNTLKLIIVPFENISSAQRLKKTILTSYYQTTLNKILSEYYFWHGTGTYEDWFNHFKIIKK